MSRVDQTRKGLGKVTGACLVMKFFSKVTKLSASFLKSSCSYIIRPNTSTSSGSETHCMPGKSVMTWAKNDMMVRSRSISLVTWGCKILTATAAVGTDGLDSGMMTGARALGPFLLDRFGSKYDGGSKSCFSVALYTSKKVCDCTPRRPKMTYLGNSPASYRCLIKHFENFVKWSPENTFYDLLCVGKRVWPSLGVHFPHTFAQQSRKEVYSRGRPLRKLSIYHMSESNHNRSRDTLNLDKCRPRAIHLDHEIVVPPNCTPSITL
jgi:hypothetical protein